MSNRRSECCAVLLAALAASCWDGALDPILGGPNGGDTDSESESESGSESETVDTEPVPCTVNVAVYVEDGETYEPYCDFTYEGLCQSSSADCVGCAWQNAEESLCEGSGVCCVDESSFATCEPYVWWWPSSLCGYFAGSCPEGTVELASMEGQPDCQGGEFCCYPVDGK